MVKSQANPGRVLLVDDDPLLRSMAADGSTFECSPELAQVFAAPAEAVAQATAESLLNRVLASDRARVQLARQATQQHGTPYPLTFGIQRFDGGIRTVFEQAVPVVDAVGRLLRVEGITQDVTERTAAEARINRLANDDELTGPALERSARLDTSCALLHVDLDRFKRVNDAVGHAGGDAALVRWQHPLNGLVPPLAFIGLAEESGMILPMTDWGLETAAADLRRRTDHGLPALPVSVNLASPSFDQQGLPAQLDALLARHGLHASSFVTDVHRGGRDSAIAASVIALGREFGLRVVAEGVETAAQSAFLLAHGCPHQQG